MRLLVNIRFVLAAMLALSILPLATGAWAHGNHEHTQTGATERQIFPSTSLPDSGTGVRGYEASGAIGGHFARQGKCGGLCCGSVCVSCCSLIAPDVGFARPLPTMMRLELSTGLSQAGLGPDRIRRPPKV